MKLRVGSEAGPGFGPGRAMRALSCYAKGVRLAHRRVPVWPTDLATL
jgi:hypothetical protein